MQSKLHFSSAYDNNFDVFIINDATNRNNQQEFLQCEHLGGTHLFLLQDVTKFCADSEGTVCFLRVKGTPSTD